MPESGSPSGGFTGRECTDYATEILANRREELERKLDKTLRLAFPKANYIVQHRELSDA